MHRVSERECVCDKVIWQKKPVETVGHRMEQYSASGENIGDRNTKLKEWREKSPSEKTLFKFDLSETHENALTCRCVCARARASAPAKKSQQIECNKLGAKSQVAPYADGYGI